MQTTGVSSATAGNATTTNSAVNRMTSDDFFRLLVTELQQQDPLEPTKTADMVSEVSQIRSIELSQQLTNTLDQLTRQQRTAGASELLGKYVEAQILAADGTISTVSGYVTGVRFGSDGVAVLELDSGETVAVADVTHVSSTDPTENQSSQKAKAAATSKAKTPAPTTGGTASNPGRWLERAFHL